jgi:predicted DNA-binding transcriptional regulator AlpA
MFLEKKPVWFLPRELFSFLCPRAGVTGAAVMQQESTQSSAARLATTLKSNGHPTTEPASRRDLRMEPFLVSAKAAATLCGVSYPTWNRRMAAGDTPAPVRFGGRVLFNRAELAEWCATRTPDGRLPTRREWEAMKAARRK